MEYLTKSSMATTAEIEAVREFNRFYTSRIGLTRNGLYKTGHSLAEARVLYELGANDITESSELRTALRIDAGQLSRLLKRMEEADLLTREPSPLDARRQQVRLTSKGKAAFATVNEQSANEIAAVLDEAAPGVVEAMQTLRRTLEPSREPKIRGLQPGDLGWLVERHGVLYAREYDWDQSFERLVAQIVADFNPETDRAWIAETHKRVGAVLCVHQDDTTAKLRTLLVEPEARGLGLGTRLVREVIRHAKERGYATLTLWTNDVLHAARRIYEREGFTLQHEAPNPAFGHDLVEQTWSLTLSEWTETS
ncbi:MAG TPA: helix-turn-helix domain-containing GNAT family N-acetyltransferase [Solirubrobacter sp.]|nr:helix-turn-helix domain-containing GNAT family N-acetyltransferase [Solirubrobacter sp.]